MPLELIIYGPSLLGIILAVYARINCELYKGKTGIAALAVTLHWISSLLIFIIFRLGEAWNGTRPYTFPILYVFCGTILITTIGLVPVTQKEVEIAQSFFGRGYIKIIIFMVILIFLLFVIVNNCFS